MSEHYYFTMGRDGPVQLTRDEAAEFWPYRTHSAAWYAARNAHLIGCCDTDQWADKPELHRWLTEMVAICTKPDLVERYRQELLTPDELAAVRREQADIEEHGW